MRVSLKNTFLTLDCQEDEFRRLLTGTKAASPRSRSLECPSPSRVPLDAPTLQIEKLNRLLDEDEAALFEVRSPVPQSPSLQANGEPACRGLPPIEFLQGPPEPFSSSGAQSPLRAGSVDGRGTGPSAAELQLLSRRLYDVLFVEPQTFGGQPLPVCAAAGLQLSPESKVQRVDIWHPGAGTARLGCLARKHFRGTERKSGLQQLSHQRTWGAERTTWLVWIHE